MIAGADTRRLDVAVDDVHRLRALERDGLWPGSPPQPFAGFNSAEWQTRFLVGMAPVAARCRCVLTTEGL